MGEKEMKTFIYSTQEIKTRTALKAEIPSAA